MSDDDFPDASGGEYGVVRIPDAWHVLSLLFFLAALGSRFVTSLIPSEVNPHLYRPFLAAARPSPPTPLPLGAGGRWHARGRDGEGAGGGYLCPGRSGGKARSS